MKITRREALHAAASLTALNNIRKPQAKTRPSESMVLLSSLFLESQTEPTAPDIAIHLDSLGQPLRLSFIPEPGLPYQPNSAGTDTLSCLYLLSQLCRSESQMLSISKRMPYIAKQAEKYITTLPNKETLTISTLARKIPALHATMSDEVIPRRNAREGLGDGLLARLPNEIESQNSETPLVLGQFQGSNGNVSGDRDHVSDLDVQIIDGDVLRVSSSPLFANQSPRYLISKLVGPALTARASVTEIGETSIWLLGRKGLIPGRPEDVPGPSIRNIDEKFYVVAYGLGRGEIKECSDLLTADEKYSAIFAALVSPIASLASKLADAFLPNAVQNAAKRAIAQSASLLFNKAYALSELDSDSPPEAFNDAIFNFSKVTFDEIIGAVAGVAGRTSVTGLLAEAYLVSQVILEVLDLTSYLSKHRWQVREIELGELGQFALTGDTASSYLVPRAVYDYFTQGLKLDSDNAIVGNSGNRSSIPMTNVALSGMLSAANRAEVLKRCQSCRVSVGGMVLPLTLDLSGDAQLESCTLGLLGDIYVNVPHKPFAGRPGQFMAVDLQAPGLSVCRLGYLKAGSIKILKELAAYGGQDKSERNVIQTDSALGTYFAASTSAARIQAFIGKPTQAMSGIASALASAIGGVNQPNWENAPGVPAVYSFRLEHFGRSPGVTNPPVVVWTYHAEGPQPEPPVAWAEVSTNGSGYNITFGTIQYSTDSLPALARSIDVTVPFHAFAQGFNWSTVGAGRSQNNPQANSSYDEYSVEIW